MAKTFPVTIMTKPYLKKYLHTLYGNPLIFTPDNLFGITLAAFLMRHESEAALTVKSHQSKEDIKSRFDRYETSIEIHLPLTFLTKRRGGFEITPQHVLTVNKLFEKRFEEDLWKLCLVMGICGVEKKKALEEFCTTYNIEVDEDITMDALKKKEERHNNKTKVFAPTLSAPTSDRFNTRKKYSPRTAPDLSASTKAA